LIALKQSSRQTLPSAWQWESLSKQDALASIPKLASQSQPCIDWAETIVATIVTFGVAARITFKIRRFCQHS
jgi:hypothetical protein